jgi:hypothetical protein
MSALAVVHRLFNWKVRGIRWIEIIGVALVGVMIFSVYIAKAEAARESASIADMERQIRTNGQRVRLLRAEVARLEQPNRLEALSREAGLGPVDVHRMVTEQGLPALAPPPEARVVVAPPPAEPAPEAAAEAAPAPGSAEDPVR